MEVVEKTVSAAEKEASAARRIELLSDTLRKIHPVFVFSINFFPILADLCSIHQTFYLCLTVDSPVLELFSKSILHPTNRIFMFDRSQYDYFHPFNPDCIFHLPTRNITLSTQFRLFRIIPPVILTQLQKPLLKYTATILWKKA